MRYDEGTVLAQVDRVSLHELRFWVHEGWVRPLQGETGPVFDELDIARIRLVRDLRTDMALPTDALPVVLSLIDRLHRTRRDLRCLADALGAQPEDIRRSVLDAYRTRHGREGDGPVP